MRSATNNRLLSTWVPPPSTSACVPANAVWTLAEITAKTAVTGWPYTGFAINGPAQLQADGDCNITTAPTSLVVVDITCGANPGACIGVDKGTAPTDYQAFCEPRLWNFKLGAQWEESYDGGIRWLRLPDMSMNLSSNKITIGMASAASANTDISYTAQFARDPDTDVLFQLQPAQLEETTAPERSKTQFYGVIDSIRISRGVARYTGNVCQPYDPYDSVSTLIDQFVVFALNIGSNNYQRPGGSVFPYYTRDHGWLTPGAPVYQSQPEILAPDIRNFYDFDTNVIPIDGGSVNFYTAHKFLTYSTREGGYRGRCGIQFPSTVQVGAATNGRDVACALVLEDCILPPRTSANTEEIFVDYATTENLAADFNGLLWGNKRKVDGNETKDTPAKTILVKDQENPEQNGIYKVWPVSGEDGASRWRRIVRAGTLATPHNYENARIFVQDGDTNAATVWYSTTTDPILDETPITFKQEQPCGVYRDDFCVEAYFKVAGFLQPGLGTVNANRPATDRWPGRRGENMTLLDTYYRKSPREKLGEEYSGVRIYFRPENGEKTGRLMVDIGPYAAEIGTSTPAITEFYAGPALRSGVLHANVFYHVSVSRERDVFRLHVNGILEDSFIAQDTIFKPQNRTREQNYMRYRGRGFCGVNSFATTEMLQFRVKPAEIFFKTSDPPYATRFNGAAGMVVSASQSSLFLNFPSNPDALPTEPSYDRKRLFTWPGAPIPDYPADTHVYIVNNISANSNTSTYFKIIPRIRFPDVDSLSVYLATVAADEEYTPNDSLGTIQGKSPVPGTRGNLSLYGLFEEGVRATGNIKLLFSTLANRTIPKKTVFRFGSVEFTPRLPAGFSQFNIVTSGTAGPNTLVLQAEGGSYAAQVPVIAKLTGANGNLSVGSTLTLGTSLGGVAAASTTHVTNLYGLLTIDGVTLTANQRVLLKDQITAAQNGIYTVKATAWERDPLLNDTEEALYGASVRVNGGTVNNGKTFFISTTNILSLGATNLNWTEYLNNLSAITALTFDGNGADDSVIPRKLDGVPVEDGMRILVKDQDDATTNGIYIARAAAWERAPDMNQTSEIQRGVRVVVRNGYTNAGQAFNIDIEDTIPDNQILLGVTEINFVEDTESVADADITATLEDGYCVGIGTEIADEPAAVVKCVTTANVSLSGLSESGTPAMDGVNIEISDEVLVCRQTNPAENGIYVVRSGAWRRATYLNKTDHFVNNFNLDAGSTPPTRSMLVAPQLSSLHADLDDASSPAARAALIRPWSNMSSVAGYADINYIRVGWRLYIQRDNFILGESPITISATYTELTKLHVPRFFRVLGIPALKPDQETGVPSVKNGTPILWDDVIVDDDFHVWRARFKCGNTNSTSRNIVVRVASALGIDETHQFPVAIR